MKLYYSILFFCLFVYLSCADDIITGVTLPDALNVRIRPDISGSVVDILPKNSKVEVLSFEGEWLKIKITSTASMWISSLFLNSENIPSENAILRAGPSVAYEQYGFAGQGGVKVLELSKNGKWARIEPKKEFIAYVNAEYVSLPEKRLQPIKVEKELDMASTPAKDLFLAGHEKNVSLEGIILPLSGNSIIATHVLVTKINDSWYPMAYLSGVMTSLKLWEHRSVRISGTQYWVEDWPRPYIEILRISPAWRQPDDLH